MDQKFSKFLLSKAQKFKIESAGKSARLNEIELKFWEIQIFSRGNSSPRKQTEN